MQNKLDKSSIQKGLLIFFGLSAASIAIVFIYTNSGETLRAIRKIEPMFLLAAVALAVADWLGGGLRVFILMRGVGQKISFATGLKAALANVAMGAMTPSQAGGGPAQVFILYKNGVEFIKGMSATLMTFMVTIIFFVISAGTITLLGINTSITDEGVRQLFRYGVGIFMLMGMLFIGFIASPRWLRAVMRLLFNFMSIFRRRHFLHPGSRANRVLEATDDFHRINVDYLRNRLPTLILAVLVTAVLFGIKCFIAYFIVRGLGVTAGIWEVVSIQILVLLMVYFFPTPGGTGAAELGSAVLMANIIPMELLPVYVVIWRIVVMYIAVGAGSFVMLRALGQDTLCARRPHYGHVEKKIASL